MLVILPLKFTVTCKSGNTNFDRFTVLFILMVKINELRIFDFRYFTDTWAQSYKDILSVKLRNTRF